MNNKIIKRLSLILISLCIGTYAWLAYLINSYADVRHETASDAALVLGAAIDGEQPSPVFRERINHAITLYKKGVVEHIIFTGGLGQNEVMTESEVALKYALAEGVPADAIYIEKISKTTYQNIVQAQTLIKKHNLKTLLLVSDPLHMKRAIIMAEDLGLSIKPAPTPTTLYQTWRTKTSFLAREAYFLSAYFICEC